jgi:hypothetical protein
MTKRVSIGLVAVAMCIGIAPMASAGNCHCHVRHHRHGCCAAPTCGCAPAPTCGCTAAPSCGAPGAMPMMAPGPHPGAPPAPAPPAPGKAAEYSPDGFSAPMRVGESARGENQTYQRNSAEPGNGNVSGDSSNNRNGQNDPAERTIQQRPIDNSTETSKTTTEEHNSNGTTSNSSNGNNAP